MRRGNSLTMTGDCGGAGWYTIFDKMTDMTTDGGYMSARAQVCFIRYVYTLLWRGSSHHTDFNGEKFST